MSRITSFGEVMMRLEVPRYATLEQGNMLQYSFSGTGVNISSALSRFGHKGYLMSVLPQNSLGEAAEAYLRRLAIQTDFVIKEGKYLGSYFLEHGFGQRASKVTYTDRWGSSFNTADFSKLDFKSKVKEVDAIHFCGITLAMNDNVRETCIKLAEAAKEANKTVIFDCNYRPSLWGERGYSFAKPYYESMLELADIVFMNEMDAIHLLGMTTAMQTRKEQLIELIPQVVNRYKIRLVAGTHRTVNSDGTHTLQGYVFKNGKFYFSEPATFIVYDRVGAGDAFASGIIHCELKQTSNDYMIQFAINAAMLAHTVGGDTPIATEQDVIAAMNQGTRDVIR